MYQNELQRLHARKYLKDINFEFGISSLKGGEMFVFAVVNGEQFIRSGNVDCMSIFKQLESEFLILLYGEDSTRRDADFNGEFIKIIKKIFAY